MIRTLKFIQLTALNTEIFLDSRSHSNSSYAKFPDKFILIKFAYHKAYKNHQNMRNSSIELTELFKYGNILGFPRLHSTTAYVCIRKTSHSPYVMLITTRIQYDSLLDSMDMNRYLVEASRQRRNKPPPDSSAIEVRRDQLDTAFALYSIRTK